jgi:hypothetical protein
MDYLSKIRESVKNMAGTANNGRFQPFLAKVKSVEGDHCVVDVDGLELTDVRLSVVIDDDEEKSVITPVVGSFVLCADLSGGLMRDPAVIGYTRIARAFIHAAEDVTAEIEGDVSVYARYVRMTAPGFIDDLTAKLNNLVSEVNALKDKYNGHSHSYSPGGNPPANTGSPTAPASAASDFSSADYSIKKKQDEGGKTQG